MSSQSIFDYQCLVIGAGLAGLATALELARRGLKTAILFDPDDRVYGSQATHGISTVKGILESDSELFGLKLEGHRGFERWLAGIEEMIGQTRPENVWISGVQERFHSRENFTKEFGRIYRRDFTGAKRVEWRKPGKQIFAEVSYPGDWWIQPSYLMETCKRALLFLGVATLHGKVHAVAQKSEYAEVVIQEAGVLVANTIIICAGAGTPGILHRSKLEFKEKIFAVCGNTYSASCDVDETIAVVKGTSGVAQIGRKIYWGSTSELARSIQGNDLQFNTRPPASSGEESRGLQQLRGLRPGSNTNSLTDIIVKWGVRVRTRHRNPVLEPISRSRQSSVWVNTGYYKSGIILSWLLGRKLADTIVSECPCSSSR